jgi:hypothetical protein
MDNLLWKWVWRFALMVGILAGILAIFANANKAPQIILYCLLGTCIILVIIGLILDFKPWRWRLFSSRLPSYLDESGRSKCPKEETFGALAIDWESHAKYGELGFSRQ